MVELTLLLLNFIFILFYFIPFDAGWRQRWCKDEWCHRWCKDEWCHLYLSRWHRKMRVFDRFLNDRGEKIHSVTYDEMIWYDMIWYGIELSCRSYVIGEKRKEKRNNRDHIRYLLPNQFYVDSLTKSNKWIETAIVVVNLQNEIKIKSSIKNKIKNNILRQCGTKKIFASKITVRTEKIMMRIIWCSYPCRNPLWDKCRVWRVLKRECYQQIMALDVVPSICRCSWI